LDYGIRGSQRYLSGGGMIFLPQLDAIISLT
jgi:hypothetical protein